MFDINLEYKEYKVGLDKLLTWCKLQTNLCCGVSANSSIQIHFTEKPADIIVNTMVSKWDTLVETDFPYVSQVMVQNTIASLKEDMVTKTYDQLTAVQKKILLGLSVTNEELGL